MSDSVAHLEKPPATPRRGVLDWLLGLSAHFDVYPTREAAFFSFHRADARARAAQAIAA